MKKIFILEDDISISSIIELCICTAVLLIPIPINQTAIAKTSNKDKPMITIFLLRNIKMSCIV